MAGDVPVIDAHMHLFDTGRPDGLAARIGRREGPSGDASRSAWAQSQRDLLRQTVRYRPVDVRHAWAAGNTHQRGLETRSYRFEFDNGLSASAVWLQALSAPQEGPATIVLNDDGRKAAGGECPTA